MNHLTVQQLSSALDGALSGPSLELVVRHLASCHECRDRQARFARFDDALRRLLAQDPHEFFLEDLTRRAESIVAAIARGMPVPPMVTSFPLVDDEDPDAPTEPPSPPQPNLGRSAEIAREAGYGRIGVKPKANVKAPKEDPEHAQRLLEALERGNSDEFSRLTVQGLAEHAEPDGPLFDLPSWVKEGSARGAAPRRPAPEVRTVRLMLDRLDEHGAQPLGKAIEEAIRREEQAPAASGDPAPSVDVPARGETSPTPGVPTPGVPMRGAPMQGAPMQSMGPGPGPDPPEHGESSAPAESRAQDPTPEDTKSAEHAAPTPVEAASASSASGVPARGAPMRSMGQGSPSAAPAVGERREPSPPRRPAPLPPVREAAVPVARARVGARGAHDNRSGESSRTLLLFALSCVSTLLAMMLAYRLLLPALRDSSLAPSRGSQAHVQLAGHDSSDVAPLVGGGSPATLGVPAPLDSLMPSPAPAPVDSGDAAPPADSLGNPRGR